jgi:hypothetical protein
MTSERLISDSKQVEVVWLDEVLKRSGALGVSRVQGFVILVASFRSRSLRLISAFEQFDPYWNHHYDPTGLTASHGFGDPMKRRV